MSMKIKVYRIDAIMFLSFIRIYKVYLSFFLAHLVRVSTIVGNLDSDLGLLQPSGQF